MNEHIKFFGVFVLAGVLAGTLSIATPSATELVLKKEKGVSVYNAPGISPFDAVLLSARAAFVQDGTTGAILFTHNADAQLPLASLTKVMTAATALSLAPRYAIVPSTEQTLVDALSYALTTSSNGIAAAVAAVAGDFVSLNAGERERWETFIAAMNAEARARGLRSFFFLNETGLDETAETAGSLGSARDVSRLMLMSLGEFPSIFDATTRADGNTNKIVADIPLLRASKTGFTDLAGGNLSIVFDAGVGKPIVVTVLGSTEEGRFADVKTLVEATLRYLQRNDI